MNKAEITERVLSVLPLSISLAFGDTISQGVATIELLHKGFAHIRDMNKDWWDSYLTAADIMILIDDQTKSAEYIQFIREVITCVAYETRKSKRDYFLNLAKNYERKYTKYSFDKKLLFLGILDNLSEAELISLLEWYGKIPQSPYFNEMNKDILRKLVGMGLIKQDFSKFNKAFEKIGEQTEDMFKALQDEVKSIREMDRHHFSSSFREVKKYDDFFDKAEVQYQSSTLGSQFVDFITLEEAEPHDPKEDREIIESLSNL